jgi:glycerophosphoryl diester phosphodiesterase
MPHTEIIAHRGASRERPENSVAAFVRAIELGADGIELDVHLSADGTLIVHHDATLHVPRLPDAAPLAIASLTVERLASFRIDGEPIPTLAEVLDAIGGRATVYCELKGPGTAAGAVELLRPLGGRAAVHSFDHRQVADARRLAPALARGVLEASRHVVPTDTLASVAARDLWETAEMIDQELIEAAHAIGGRVIAWTVDDETTMRRLAAMGVDGLCTNDVTLCRRTLRG